MTRSKFARFTTVEHASGHAAEHAKVAVTGTRHAVILPSMGFFIKALVALFTIVDPIGLVPVVLAPTENSPRAASRGFRPLSRLRKSSHAQPIQHIQHS